MDEEIDRTILRGRVMDRRSGKGLSYATIALYGQALGSITNEAGIFLLQITLRPTRSDAGGILHGL